MRSCNHKVPTVYTSEVRIWQSSQMRKKWQKLMQGLNQKHMHIFRLWREHVQSFKKIGIKLYVKLCSRGTHCLYTKSEKRLSSQCGKSDKIDQIVISKTHAYPHTCTMKKMHAKFHKDRYKTVRGVALTWGTHCLYTEGEKWLSLQCGKSNKK